MGKTPLISVIIPVYNLEKYISKTILSIIKQTYPKLELIIIDDGSTDNSLDIIKKFENQYPEKIRVIHQENKGVSASRINGVIHSTGEYIGFVDGDDFIENKMYEILLNNIQKYQADISHCGYQRIYPNGKIEYVYNTKKIVVQDKNKGLEDLLSGEYIEPGLCNKLFKRELIEKVINKGVIDTKIKINEDLLMNYYIFKESNKSIYEDVCLYHYIFRRNSASKAKINENKLKDPMKVLKIIEQDIEDNFALSTIIEQRIVRQLIMISTMSLKESPEIISPYRFLIRQELHKKLNGILFGNKCSTRIKIMALWADIAPSSYRWFHMQYMKMKGIDKKYSVE